MAEGKLDLDTMVTKAYRLQDINICIQNLIAGSSLARQVIQF